MGLKIVFFKNVFLYRYYFIKRLVVTSLEDIPTNGVHRSRILYSPFYNSFFLLMTVDRPFCILYKDVHGVQQQRDNFENLFPDYYL